MSNKKLELEVDENYIPPLPLIGNCQAIQFVLNSGHLIYTNIKSGTLNIDQISLQNVFDLQHEFDNKEQQYVKEIEELKNSIQHIICNLEEENTNLKTQYELKIREDTQNYKIRIENLEKSLRKAQEDQANLHSTIVAEVSEQYITKIKDLERQLYELRNKEVELNNNVVTSQNQLIQELRKNKEFVESLEEKHRHEIDHIKTEYRSLEDQYKKELDILKTDITTIREKSATEKNSIIEEMKELYQKRIDGYVEHNNMLLNQIQSLTDDLKQMQDTGKIKSESAYDIGERGEGSVREELKKQFPLANVTKASSSKENGDIRFIYNNKSIFIEVKNKETITLKDLEGFRNILNLHIDGIDAAIFISLRSPVIGNYGSFHIDWQKDKPVIYTHIQDAKFLSSVINMLTCLTNINRKQVDINQLQIPLSKLYRDIHYMTDCISSNSRSIDHLIANNGNLEFLKDRMLTEFKQIYESYPSLEVKMQDRIVHYDDFNDNHIEKLKKHLEIPNTFPKKTELLKILDINDAEFEKRGGLINLKMSFCRKYPNTSLVEDPCKIFSSEVLNAARDYYLATGKNPTIEIMKGRTTVGSNYFRNDRGIKVLRRLITGD